MKYAAVIIGIILLMQPSGPHYAAPYGTGAGTPDNPMALSTALAAGGEIWLLPGTYAGDWTVSTPGVTLRSVPGTRARINGGVTITGAGVTIRDLEITDTSWLTRTTATPAQAARSVSVQAQNVTLDGLWIHDLANGVGAFNGSGGASAGLVVKNSLFYNIGYGSGLGTGHGHGIYVQNDSAGVKLFEGNTIANGYGFSVQAYGSSGPSANLERMTFNGNVSLNNRFLIGGGQPLRQITITNNRLFKSNLQVGYGTTQNEDVAITGNWLGLARLQVQRVITPTVSLNRIVVQSFEQDVYHIGAPPAAAWDANAYYRPTPNTAQPFAIDGQGFYSLSQWRTITGWDATSTYTNTLPTQSWVEILAISPHHGRVVVYNWTGANSIALDLTSSGLTPGATYRLVNAQNVAESLLFVAGGLVAIPSSGWTVATPYGASGPLVGVSPSFLVFLVEPGL